VFTHKAGIHAKSVLNSLYAYKILKPEDFAPTGWGSAIIDTGITLIYIPTSAYCRFLSAAGGKTNSNTGLGKFTKKPTGMLAFTLGGTSFTLSLAQYLASAARVSNFGVPSSGYYSYVGDGGAS
jgi:hypothetical protein